MSKIFFDKFNKINYFGIFILFVQACGLPVADDVEQQYAETARKLGLTPVYPPREEFQVGDVYIVAEPKNGAEKSVRFYSGTRPELLDLAEEYLKTRIAFTKTASPSELIATDGKARAQDDLIGEGLQTRGELKAIKTLPIAAFPSITAETAFSSSASRLSPLRSVGLFASRGTLVTLDFKDVRTYQAEIVTVNSFFGQVLQNDFSPFCSQSVQLLSDAIEANGGKPFEWNFRYLVVTRVYLTRQIDYTFRNKQILALANQTRSRAATTATQPGSEADGVSLDTVASPFSGANIIINTATESQEKSVFGEEVAGALQSLNQSADQTTGDRFSATSLSAYGLTLQRAFERPVAIAYDGLSYDFENYLTCAGAMRFMKGN